MENDPSGKKRFSGFMNKFKKREESTEKSQLEVNTENMADENHVEEISVEEKSSKTTPEHQTKSITESILEPIRESEPNYKSNPSYGFEQFVDERILVSHDALGSKEMKMKVLEVSDERAPTRWKFGDRVKVNKILITIKHLHSQEIEEGEFDIESIEKELAEKRHYSSTNRWVPVNDIKNGYVIGARHTSLISDALALDYIAF